MDPTEAADCRVASAGRLTPGRRQLVQEQPLTITVGDTPVVTLMRMPGDDLALALGYLKTEGIIAHMADVGAIAHCQDADAGGTNVVRVTLASPSAKPLPEYRRVYSSCSVCGAELIDALVRDVPPFDRPGARLSASGIAELAETMRTRQSVFAATGGTHGAALARLPLTPESIGEAIVREDVGRHNALDKAVGVALSQGWDLGRTVLVLSSRVSYEMLAKSARAGISDVAGVSAPTALAVHVAQRLNMFLAGFVRGQDMTVYAGAEALDTMEEP